MMSFEVSISACRIPRPGSSGSQRAARLNHFELIHLEVDQHDVPGLAQYLSTSVETPRRDVVVNELHPLHDLLLERRVHIPNARATGVAPRARTDSCQIGAGGVRNAASPFRSAGVRTCLFREEVPVALHQL